MNFRNLCAELSEIRANPNDAYVTITETDNEIRYVFHNERNCYYYPYGVVRISRMLRGAGVIYVYTTNDQYPHLTIPDTGQGLHWTDTDGGRSESMAAWPISIQNFVRQFPD